MPCSIWIDGPFGNNGCLTSSHWQLVPLLNCATNSYRSRLSIRLSIYSGPRVRPNKIQFDRTKPNPVVRMQSLHQNRNPIRSIFQGRLSSKIVIGRFDWPDQACHLVGVDGGMGERTLKSEQTELDCSVHCSLHESNKSSSGRVHCLLVFASALALALLILQIAALPKQCFGSLNQH